MNRRSQEIRVDSPLVRRLRLARELLALREGRGLSQLELAKRCEFSRFRIQRLENAESRPNLNDVFQIMEVLGVDEDSAQWRELQRVARDAAKRGWWDEKTYRKMSDRQRVAADLELGASVIRIYDHAIVPGLLQTEAYYRELNAAVAAQAEQFDPEVEVASRMERQRQFQKGSGRLEVVIEEIAVQHLFVSEETMRAQLAYLASVADSERISVRVIPTKVVMKGARPPRAPFMLFDYPDQADPDLVFLEGIEEDKTYTDEKVQSYATLFDRFADAALSPSKSAGYFAEAAS